MLNILVVFTDIGKHVMHVVLGRPPLQRKTAQKCSLNSSEKDQIFVPVVCCRVRHPSDQNLSKSKAHDAHSRIRSCETDDPGCGEKQAE